jgi:hypothetical protein
MTSFISHNSLPFAHQEFQPRNPILTLIEQNGDRLSAKHNKISPLERLCGGQLGEEPLLILEKKKNPRNIVAM